MIEPARPSFHFQFSGDLHDLRALAEIFKGDDAAVDAALAHLSRSVASIEGLATDPPVPPPPSSE